MPAAGVRAGSGADRHGDRFYRRRAAGCHRRGGERRDRQPLRSRDGRARYLSDPSARWRLHDYGGTLWFRDGEPQRRAAAGWPDRQREFADGSFDRSGDRHRHRRGASPQRVDVEPWAATSIRSRWQELPVQGRNWMGLALLAPGSRTASGNAQAPLPDRNNGEVREFQLNMDGQQISSELGTGNQPKFSQDSIAEFQFISNRFDATQGRSSGVQVNVITKSGTNALSGLFRTNFQSDKLQRRRSCGGPQAADQQPAVQHGARRTDSAQQAALLRQLRVRARARWPAYGPRRIPPSTSSSTGSSRARLPASRIDYQLSENTRLMGRVSGQNTYTPFGGGSATAHPASTIDTDEHNREYLGSLTQVLSNRAVNEIKGGYSPLRVREQDARDLVEALAGLERHHERLPAHRRLPASPSTPTRTRRVIATRRSRRFATTSRSRTRRAAVTTCGRAPSS